MRIAHSRHVNVSFTTHKHIVYNAETGRLQIKSIYFRQTIS